MAELKDTDKMPFGKHRGMAMVDVPASYLLWWLENGKPGNVMDYCIANKSVLQQETEQAKANKTISTEVKQDKKPPTGEKVESEW